MDLDFNKLNFWYRLYNQELHGVYSPAMGVGTIGSGGYIDYPSVCRALAMGAQSQFDEDCRVPYAYWKRNWISYDDERSLEEKVTKLQSGEQQGQ